MVDAQNGWAFANLETMQRHHVLRTEDGGETWRDVSPVYDAAFQSFILDDQAAWLWNIDTAWCTLDGGSTWTTLEGGFGWGLDIWFNDIQHGWKLNAEYWGLSFVQFDIDSFSTTDDGGETWQEATKPSDDGVVLFMAYPTDQMAWAVSAGFAKTMEGVPDLAIPFGIQFTVDRGSTWSTREMPLPPGVTREDRTYEGAYLGGVGNCNFISPLYSSSTIWKLALTCETQSWMYTTTNQGETWILSSMPAGNDARMQFVDPSNGWLFLGGWSKDYQGNLYRTNDGGQSWELVKRTGWGEMRMSFVDARTGWAVACSHGICEQTTGNALVVTRDGGETWQEIKPRVVP